MILTPIRQTDPRWKNVRIGKSATTIGKDGCLLCDICVGLQKLRGEFINPKNAAFYWSFNLKGELLWEKTFFKGAKFVERGYYKKYERIAEFANDPNRFAVIEVDNGKHWLYVVEARGKELKVMDPIDGKIYSGLPAKYSLTGYALFEAVKIEMAEWLKPLMNKAKSKGLTENDPAKKWSFAEFLEGLLEMGLIDKPKGEVDKITIGESLAALEKIADRWGTGGGGF